MYIEIQNANFFEDIKIDFSNKLNCIMGGRGTGKTTILYFLMSAIYKNSEKNSKLKNVLHPNLAGGEINVAVEDSNGKDLELKNT
jgi:DNA repair exonuclease SbcCD ATPase subunit